MKSKNISFLGRVISIQPNANYVVKINIDNKDFFALCYLCGKMTKHFITPNIGDEVRIEVSEYEKFKDKIKGRIIQRLK